MSFRWEIVVWTAPGSVQVHFIWVRVLALQEITFEDTSKLRYMNSIDNPVSENAIKIITSLQWRHNECDGVPNYQPHDCLLKLLFRRRSKKTSKLRVIGLCEENSTATGEFPAQRASNAEIFPIDDVIMTFLSVCRSYKAYSIAILLWNIVNGQQPNNFDRERDFTRLRFKKNSGLICQIAMTHRIIWLYLPSKSLENFGTTI